MGFTNPRNTGSGVFLALAGGTMTGTLNMNANAITNSGDITAANANGFMLENAAASSTNPTLIPNRANATTGVGSASSAIVDVIAAGARAQGIGSADNLTVLPTNGAYASANNGSIIYNVKVATTLLATTGGAGTQTATNLIPAASIVHGVVCRVTTAVTGCTSFSVGDGTDADRWGAGILVAANTTSTPANFTTTNAAHIYTAATSVVLTAAGGGAVFSTGAVRIVVYYSTIDAPTS